MPMPAELSHPDTQIEALWYTRCPVPSASSLAIDNGWLDAEFEPDGISVASLRASAERGVRESHFDHSQADSFRQGGNIPPIWTRSRGGDTALVAISWTDEYQAVIAMPGAGIESPADLRGRRLGLPRRVNDQIDYWRAMCLLGYLSTLSLAGLGPDLRTLKHCDRHHFQVTDVSLVDQLLDVGMRWREAVSLCSHRRSVRLRRGRAHFFTFGRIRRKGLLDQDVLAGLQCA